MAVHDEGSARDAGSEEPDEPRRKRHVRLDHIRARATESSPEGSRDGSEGEGGVFRSEFPVDAHAPDRHDLDLGPGPPERLDVRGHEGAKGRLADIGIEVGDDEHAQSGQGLSRGCTTGTPGSMTRRRCRPYESIEWHLL
jgi:hypothetical protein